MNLSQGLSQIHNNKISYKFVFLDLYKKSLWIYRNVLSSVIFFTWRRPLLFMFFLFERVSFRLFPSHSFHNTDDDGSFFPVSVCISIKFLLHNRSNRFNNRDFMSFLLIIIIIMMIVDAVHCRRCSSTFPV